MSISPYEYLKSIQSQHDTSVAHGSMEYMDIIRNCTSWPPWTRFASIVQHIDPTERDTLGQIFLGQATGQLSHVESNYQHADMLVRSVTSTRTTIDISLTVREGKVPLSFANEMMRLLHATIMLLISAPARSSLSLDSLDGYTMTRIPFASPPEQDVRSVKPAKSVLPNRARAINKVVDTAWNAVVGNCIPPPSSQSDTPFYEIWGSLLPAVELAQYYTTHLADLKLPGLQHASFSAEEIISHPTMADQYELIVSKQRTSQNKRHSRSPTRDANDWNARVSPAPPDAQAGLQPPAPGGVAGGSHSSSSTYQQPVSRFSDSSMSSMTSGSSRSDQDELWDVARLGKSVTLHKIKPKQLLGLSGAKAPVLHMVNVPMT